MKEDKRKGFIVWDTLIPWLIALFVLAVSVVMYMTLGGKGAGLLDFLKRLVASR